MHLNLLISVSLFIVLLSVCGPSSALPFITRTKAAPESLAARATYSIVPIDGGSQGSDPTEAPGTVIETVIVTQSPATKTVLESSPPVTDTITVTADPATRTVPTTVSVVDIRSTTDIVTRTVHLYNRNTIYYVYAFAILYYVYTLVDRSSHPINYESHFESLVNEDFAAVYYDFRQCFCNYGFNHVSTGLELELQLQLQL
ncbi:hypothetical protein Hte_001028 [Hypoxylon texense]